MDIGLIIILAIAALLIIPPIWFAWEEHKIVSSWPEEDQMEFWLRKHRQHMTPEERTADDLRAIRKMMEEENQ